MGNTDYLIFSHAGPHAGYPFKNYVLTLEKAKEISMLERGPTISSIESH
ncbi:antA/AntB antirepressor family protein [Candidatus Williamhamiltonella defendens]